jgi:hypothetical protein
MPFPLFLQYFPWGRARTGFKFLSYRAVERALHSGAFPWVYVTQVPLWLWMLTISVLTLPSFLCISTLPKVYPRIRCPSQTFFSSFSYLFFSRLQLPHPRRHNAVSRTHSFRPLNRLGHQNGPPSQLHSRRRVSRTDSRHPAHLQRARLRLRLGRRRGTHPQVPPLLLR